jgi:hypothetical protein
VKRHSETDETKTDTDPPKTDEGGEGSGTEEGAGGGDGS